MTLSEISIRRPVFAWMLMFGLIIFGAICFERMGISQMPDINFPVVNIYLRLDNAAPEVMETDVVDIIEDSVMGIEGLTRVTSSVSEGIANITCEFKMDPQRRCGSRGSAKPDRPTDEFNAYRSLPARDHENQS